MLIFRVKHDLLHFLSNRPDLADQHKVGFFGLDRTSQTDVTEIVDLKEMTEVLQILLQVSLSDITTWPIPYLHQTSSIVRKSPLELLSVLLE